MKFRIQYTRFLSFIVLLVPSLALASPYPGCPPFTPLMPVVCDSVCAGPVIQSAFGAAWSAQLNTHASSIDAIANHVSSNKDDWESQHNDIIDALSDSLSDGLDRRDDFFSMINDEFAAGVSKVQSEVTRATKAQQMHVENALTNFRTIAQAFVDDEYGDYKESQVNDQAFSPYVDYVSGYMQQRGEINNMRQQVLGNLLNVHRSTYLDLNDEYDLFDQRPSLALVTEQTFAAVDANPNYEMYSLLNNGTSEVEQSDLDLVVASTIDFSSLISEYEVDNSDDTGLRIDIYSNLFDSGFQLAPYYDWVARSIEWRLASDMDIESSNDLFNDNASVSMGDLINDLSQGSLSYSEYHDILGKMLYYDPSFSFIAAMSNDKALLQTEAVNDSISLVLLHEYRRLLKLSGSNKLSAMPRGYGL